MAGRRGTSDGSTGGVPDRSPTGVRHRRAVAVGLGAALVAVAGVAAVDVARAPAAEAALLPFDSCEELTSWYRDTALSQVGAYGLGGTGWGRPMGGAVLESAAADSSGGAGSSGGEGAARSASGAGVTATGGAVGSSEAGTNVQEAGVGEPARVQTADGLAFTLTGDRLVVVDLAEGAVRGSVDLAPGSSPGDPELQQSQQEWFSELLLVGDRVVVLGSGTLPGPVEDEAGAGVGAASDMLLPWGPSTTTATTVDVGDPASPTVLDRVEVEGGYVSARASGGDVRLVTTATPFLPFVDPWLLQQDNPAPLSDPPVDGAPTAELEAEALEHNRQVVREATVADWLPDLVERADDGTVTSSAPVDCASVSHPGAGAGSGTVTVLTLDPTAADTLAGTTSVSADGSLVYAATDRLYVATTRGGWLWQGPTSGDGSSTSTELHGFDTATGGRTSYLGSGSVDGFLLGSWALDAQDGYLRVGTTTEAPAGDGAAGSDGGGDAVRPAPVGGTSSSVVVLQEAGDGLVEVGRVDGLGPGEQIRSLRWFDDLAVVVTFRQTDPLYTVDLSEPSTPRVLGELKVLGYSGYLHPIGDGLLLGVGQDGDTSGALLGTKVETYDVSDLAAPVDVDATVWPSSSSAVEWDSRLFAYLPGSRTAILALERYDETSYASGLVAVGVGEDGSLAETGSWLREDGGGVAGLATTDDLVVVATERWDLVDGTEQPLGVLTLLAVDGLAVVAEVPLG